MGQSSVKASEQSGDPITGFTGRGDKMVRFACGGREVVVKQIIFALLLVGVPTLTLVWWVWADRRLRRVLRGVRGGAWVRVALAVFAGLAVGPLALLLVSRGWWALTGGDWEVLFPAWWQSLAMVWGVLVLPLVAVPTMMWAGGWAAWKRVWGERGTTPSNSVGTPDATADSVTRRDLLRTAVAAVPVVATLGATVVGLVQLQGFRVRHITVPLPDLPPGLDGLTIAHVADTHVGRLTRGPILHRLTDAVNAMRPDLIAFAGDLINYHDADLPEAIAMLRRFDPAVPLFIIEGNHDVIVNRETFRDAVRGAGFRLMLDEAQTLTLTGRFTGERLRLLGISWRNEAEDQARALLQREAAAGTLHTRGFPILLAHHPHTFDPAAAFGVPLTLSGHTHGGQLMLAPGIGAGPLMFRYWTGLYQRGRSSLVVSNGVGNWFPLRTGAPAELVRVTLRRG